MRHDPQDPDEEHPAAAGVASDALGPERAEDVLPGDLGQARHHEHVGRHDAPSAPPAGAGAEGPGRPGEGGAAVGVGLVELVVAGHEEHRDEGQDGHDGGLQRRWPPPRNRGWRPGCRRGRWRRRRSPCWRSAPARPTSAPWRTPPGPTGTSAVRRPSLSAWAMDPSSLFDAAENLPPEGAPVQEFLTKSAETRGAAVRIGHQGRPFRRNSSPGPVRGAAGGPAGGR